MDEIGSMVAQAIARRIKAARAQQAQTVADGQARARAAIERRAQAGDSQAQALLDRMKAAGLLAPVGAAAAARPPSTPVSPSPAPVVATSDPSALASSLDGDSLPGLPTTILDGMTIERPMLLTAFSSDAILPALVFAEALAKPMALREGGPGSSF